MIERSFDQQTTLEKTLRAYLWTPTDRLRRAKTDLSFHTRRREYRMASECQEAIMKAEHEIAMWTELLRLYENERAHWTSQK